MPVTFPAHQGLILPVKLRWPRAIDGTALCIGAAAPDLAYPLGPWLNAQSHTAIGLVVWSLPVTLVMATLVRWRAADGVFANMPDLGLLRLRSYRVLGWRRPTALVTATSAVVGSGSHILIDGFTHKGRWGANALGLNDVIGTVPIRGVMTEARLLQYLGHFGGSVLFILSLILIASTGRLDRWYSTELVVEARQAPSTRGGPLLFWVPVLAATATAIGVSQQTGRSVLFLPVLVAAIAPVVMGTLVGRSARRPVGDNTGMARLR
ncbi:MAG: DUF4184 family protein [Acidimicrobiales bacterium]